MTMKKEAFVTKEQLEEIAEQYPTPFHLYDEKGIKRICNTISDGERGMNGYEYYGNESC